MDQFPSGRRTGISFQNGTRQAEQLRDRQNSYETGRMVTGQAEWLRVGRMVAQVAEQVEEGQAEREMTVWVCSFARTYSNRWAVRRLEDNHGKLQRASWSGRNACGKRQVTRRENAKSFNMFNT
jgi:hypothetical protein